MLIWELAALFVLIVLSALFSAAEAAILTISRIRARTLADKKIKGAAELLYLRENLRKTVTTILVFNSAITVSASAIATSIGIQYFGSNGLGIATGAMTIVLLTVGEVIPKAIGTSHPTRTALAFARPLAALHKLLAPVLVLFEKLSSTAAGAFGPERKPAVTDEDIRATLQVGVERSESVV